MGNIYGEFLIKNHYGALNRTNEAEELILIFVNSGRMLTSQEEYV